jgi:hypothetical protein
MLCPKCNLVFDERFCPQCGLDLQIYADLTALKGEVESLRNLVLSGSQPKPEITAPLSGTQESGTADRGKMPPPLPAGVIKAERKKSPDRGSSAEIAVGQKWLLGIGVLILIIGIGFFLKYAFDQQWSGGSDLDWVRRRLGAPAGRKRLSSAQSPWPGHWDRGGWPWNAIPDKLCRLPG